MYSRKDGEYYYAPHRSVWGVWKWHARIGATDGSGIGVFVKDCYTKEKARDEVYRLNGWGKPKDKSKPNSNNNKPKNFY